MDFDLRDTQSERLEALRRVVETAGGAHAGAYHRIDDHYAIAIPETRIVNPYGQADWEAIGIQPDIKVPAAEALKTASRRAESKIQEPGIHLYLQHH